MILAQKGILRAFLLLSLLLLPSCTRDRPAPDPIELPPAQVTLPDDTTGSGGEVAAPAVAQPQEGQVPAVEGANNSDQSPQPAVQEATPIVVVPTPQQGTETIQYTVKSGDTLFSIAENFGVSPDVIRQLNYLSGDNLQASQVLRIPLLEGYTAEGRPTATPEPLIHIVQSGETLYGIALQYGVDPTSIIAANNIADQNGIFVGQGLRVPGYAASPSAGAVQLQPTEEVIVIDPSNSIGSPVGVTSGTPAPSNTVQVVHVVQSGEGLYAIAAQYNISAVDIANANNIQNYELLRVGQQLYIPGVAADAPPVLANRRIHIVQAGESLLQIAVNYGISAVSIAVANNINDTDLIYPGQQLVIPEP